MRGNEEETLLIRVDRPHTGVTMILLLVMQ